jgi:hypothetical protein
MVPADGPSIGLSQPLFGAPQATATSRSNRGSWVVTGLLAVVSSLLAWPGLLVLDGKFPVENLSVEMTNLIRNDPNDPVAWAQERMNRWTSLAKTAASCLAMFGGVFVGLANCRDGVTARWSPQRVLVGIGLGVAAGILGGVAEATVFVRLDRAIGDRMLLTAIGHAVAWACLAAVLNPRLPMIRAAPGEWVSRLLKVFGGAVLASLIYAALAAMAFPMLRSDLPIPEGNFNKLVFLIVAAGVLGSICLGPGKKANSTTVAPGEVPSTSNIATT